MPSIASSRADKALCYLTLLVLCLMTAHLLRDKHVIVINANVLTMDAQGSVRSALAWRNGLIESVGSNEQVLKGRRWYTDVRDLQKQTVIPGFVDAHSHFPASGTSRVTLDLSSPPLGTVEDLDQLFARVASAVNVLPEGEWLIGFNYDQASLSEGRHPLRQELDAISQKHPVYLYHSSGHMGVANTLALQQLLPSNSAQLSSLLTHSGLLHESDAPSLAALLGRMGWSSSAKIFFAARDEYAEAGVTTVVNGATNPRLLKVLWALSHTALMPLRTLVSPVAQKPSESLNASYPAAPEYRSLRQRLGHAGFFLGPAKFTVDGSPQGYTAFLSQPYWVAQSAIHADNPNWRGELLWQAEQLEAAVRAYHKAGWQLALHGNGDAAIEFILDLLEKIDSEITDRGKIDIHAEAEHRPLLVHAQTATEAQIVRMHQLGVSPTFFASHVYYWGDWHTNTTLGPERAANISPTGWALKNKLRFSLHSDAPVTPMQPLRLLAEAVERLSFEGRLLGAAQRISREQALRALTIDAAWQYFLDDRLGSIEVGKFADLTVLSADPLADGPVREIQVRQTIVGGKRVFLKP